jgi:hypothetical protein
MAAVSENPQTAFDPKTGTQEQKAISETKIPLLSLPTNYDPILRPPLTLNEREKLHQLSEYVDTILLPQTDENYAHERAWASEACFKRYLRAAKWNLRDAKQRIKYTIEWRREYKPDSIDPKEVEPEVFINLLIFRRI